MSLKMYSKNVVSFIKTFLVKKNFYKMSFFCRLCFWFLKHLLTLYFERLVSFVFQVLLRPDNVFYMRRMWVRLWIKLV